MALSDRGIADLGKADARFFRTTELACDFENRHDQGITILCVLGLSKRCGCTLSPQDRGQVPCYVT